MAFSAGDYRSRCTKCERPFWQCNCSMVCVSCGICRSDGRLAQRICVDLELSVKEVETGQCNKIAL
jgi:hypothetical protein